MLRRKSKQSGAGADIGNQIKALALPLHGIEHCQTAAGCFMSAGAECLAGFDPERLGACRNIFGITICMNKKPARADWRQASLAYCQPVFIGQFFEGRLCICGAGDKRLNLDHDFCRRLAVEIGQHFPFGVIERLDFPRYNRRRRRHRGDNVINLIKRLRLRACAGEGEAPVIGHSLRRSHPAPRQSSTAARRAHRIWQLLQLLAGPRLYRAVYPPTTYRRPGFPDNPRPCRSW